MTEPAPVDVGNTSKLSPAPLGLEGMTPEQLDAERRRIVQSANGNYRDLSEEDLMKLAYITGTLRRRSSGPPKTPKAASTRGPKVKPTLDSIGDDFA